MNRSQSGDSSLNDSTVITVENEKEFEHIGLYFSASDLPKMDIFSDTDAFIVVYIQDAQTKKYRCLGHTQVIMNANNPEWMDQLCYHHNLGNDENQLIKILIYDQDDSSKDQMDFEAHDYIGCVTFELKDLIAIYSKTLKLQIIDEIKNKPNRGFLTVKYEIQKFNADFCDVEFSAKNLVDKDFFTKSDPFIVISRIFEDGTWVVVWKNEPIFNNLNPIWPVAKIPMMILCNGDIDRALKITLLDFDSNGKHDYLGSIQCTVRSLMHSCGEPFEVIEEKKKERRGYINSGTFYANNMHVQKEK